MITKNQLFDTKLKYKNYDRVFFYLIESKII